MIETFHERLLISLAVWVITATGCASRAVPIGDWGRPADLHLSPASLKDVKVAVRCGSFDPQGKVVPHDFPICHALERQLKALGAVIPEDENEAVKYTLWYVERGAVATDSSFVSEAAFYFSGGLVPLVSSYRTRAELRIHDERGVLLDRAPVELDIVNVFGWSALFANFAGNPNHDPEIGANFYRFAENRLVSQVTVRR